MFHQREDKLSDIKDKKNTVRTRFHFVTVSLCCWFHSVRLGCVDTELWSNHRGEDRKVELKLTAEDTRQSAMM